MLLLGLLTMCKHVPETAADPVKRTRFIADCQKLIAMASTASTSAGNPPDPSPG